MRGFLVSGPGTGVGKTTVSAGLMAALRKRGLRVQPFKCGPDFIDPGHHTPLCGRLSHNLDTWMLSADQNQRIFRSACQGADIAVVEGMMGLFDGVQGSGLEGSSAEIAKLLGLPILLVVDASSSAGSVAALVHGFQTFDPELRIAGVVLNRVSNHSHAQLLVQALRSRYPVLPVGWIPLDERLRLKERHLGLQVAEERTWTDNEMERLATHVQRGLPVDAFLELSQVNLPPVCDRRQGFSEPSVRIGVARDKAFCFYYEAGLAELRSNGAELIEFSPLNDAKLPEGLDALYFGGGYPELHAETLSANRSLISAIRDFSEIGHPIYGECGGLIYIGRELAMLDGRKWPMAGVLPTSIQMTDRLVHFGYADLHFLEDGLAEKDTWVRGHSFHYSKLIDDGGTDKKAVAHYSLSGDTRPEGFTAGNIFGSYIHIHFAGSPLVAARFVSLARSRKLVQK